MYIAGIGNDPREDRHFNIQAQAKKYDADGQFVKYWIPEIRNIDSHSIHAPESWDDAIYHKNKYSRPIVDLAF
jgi:deoxyribodipyrimidine photo-lyase